MKGRYIEVTFIELIYSIASAVFLVRLNALNKILLAENLDDNAFALLRYNDGKPITYFIITIVLAAIGIMLIVHKVRQIRYERYDFMEVLLSMVAIAVIVVILLEVALWEANRSVIQPEIYLSDTLARGEKSPQFHPEVRATNRSPDKKRNFTKFFIYLTTFGCSLYHFQSHRQGASGCICPTDKSPPASMPPMPQRLPAGRLRRPLFATIKSDQPRLVRTYRRRCRRKEDNRMDGILILLIARFWLLWSAFAVLILCAIVDTMHRRKQVKRRKAL